jgi:conjugal transfer/entry exclusion protein
MPGIKTLEENIERLEAAIDRAQDAAREANSATKAANQAKKELFDTVKEFEKMVDDAISERIRNGLEEYADTLSTQTRVAHQKVMDEFDKLANLMLYGNERGKGQSVVEEWLTNAIRTEVVKMLQDGIIQTKQ